MNQIWLIAREEWRYWGRSRLTMAVLAIAVILTIASAISTGLRMNEAMHERAHLQQQAENTFYSQPNRHPHRMVHYGHYVFRTPPPLSMLDPGVDTYTGTAMFLEGHRQNTAMFAERRQNASLVQFGNMTPAFILQVMAPLCLILIGYSTITREYEAGTLKQLAAQGLSPMVLIAGKGLALVGAGLLMLLPLVIGTLSAALVGEAAWLALLFICGYMLYLLVWSGIILLVSGITHHSGMSFGVLICLWIAASVLTPVLASSVAGLTVNSPGKIETDFEVLAELRKLGDGHNASDPAFAKLKANLLAQYGVERVEDLPVNYRGVVATSAEADLTKVLNRFAEQRMRIELAQANVARHFGWLSPVLAMREFSMLIAGTDLTTHHRFLREAETLRFDFVQALNQVHVEHLAYSDDINRSNDEASSRRARVSADNWQVLQNFAFQPNPPIQRLSISSEPLFKLIVWLGLIAFLCKLAARRLTI